MLHYMMRRLGASLLVLFFVSIVTFLIMNLAPGDPLSMFIDPERPVMTEEQADLLRHKLGLDQPLIVRYSYWLKNWLIGNWGYSIASKTPVANEVLSRLPNTALLSATALVLAVAVAIPIGVLSAVRQYSALDYVMTSLSFVGISVPRFWLALVLVTVFSMKLHWLPSVGMHSLRGDLVGMANVLDVARHLVLPALVMASTQMASWMRYQRSSLLEVVRMDYIRTARAKGLSEWRVILRHALRNAIIPILTLLGLTIPALFSGSYITETIFGWPGIGRLGVNAIISRDYPVIMGVTMLSAILVLAGNLIADLCYAAADPRIHYD
jgi:peptide/nickel transport system permease protein